MRYRILPYRQGSRGAAALAAAISRGRVLRLEGSTFRPSNGDILINWGSTTTGSSLFTGYAHNLNVPEVVRTASNKLHFFRAIEGASYCPDFWTSRDDIPDDAFPIVCRTVLAGHSGEGIVIADDRSQLVQASLYVKYVKKQQEYRIHVGVKQDGDTRVISVQRKARRSTTPDNEVNWKVRNLAGGFVYVREGFTVPDAVTEAAADALTRTGLTFGAVDVI